jgi:hydrogenase-1 operon protein HyaE
MSLEAIRKLTEEELRGFMDSKETFILYVRSERDRDKIREMFDVDVVFPELARSFPELSFFIVEIGECRETLKDLGVFFAPCVLYFKKGKLLRKHEGIRSWAEYTESVGELLC